MCVAHFLNFKRTRRAGSSREMLLGMAQISVYI